MLARFPLGNKCFEHTFLIKAKKRSNFYPREGAIGFIAAHRVGNMRSIKHAYNVGFEFFFFRHNGGPVCFFCAGALFYGFHRANDSYAEKGSTSVCAHD